MFTVYKTDSLNPLRLILDTIGRLPIITPVVFVTIFSFFFLPAIQIGGFGLRIDDITLLLIAPLIILQKRVVRLNTFIVLMLVFFASMLMSTFHGYMILDVPSSGRDANEIIRLMKPLLFAILLYYIGVEKLTNLTFKIFYYGSIFIIIVGFLEYFDPVGLGTILSKIFTSDSQINTAIESEVRRITLTGSGPNDGAVIATYFLFFNYFLFIYTKHKKYFFLFSLLFISIVFTSSRTVLAGILLALSLNILFSSKVSIFLKLTIVSLFFAAIVYLLPYFSYIYDGFLLAYEGQNTSLLKRFEIWDEAYALFLQSPYLGWGPAKEIHSTIVDGEYFLFLRRFGILGLLFLFSLILLPLCYIKNLGRFKNFDIVIIYSTALYIMPVALLIMMTNNYFSGYQSFLPYVLLITTVIRLNSKL